jgi:transcriptional regulator with PAS, ATPase and Fis domain
VANGGTVLLDEITAIPPALQAKLLEVIEAREFIPVGADRPVQVDVRIVATTNEDLETCLTDGTLRPDLYYRLNEVDIEMPPLRERRKDIPLLANYFMHGQCEYFGKSVEALDSAVLDRFMSYEWPGNVRELQNTIKRGILTGKFEPVQASDNGMHTQRFSTPSPATSEQDPEQSSAGGNGKDYLADVCKTTEKEAVGAALVRAQFSRTETARLLGISKRCLRRKIRQFYGKLTNARRQSLVTEIRSPEVSQALRKGQPLADIVATAEQEAISQILRRCTSRTQAAAHLGVSYSTLRRKIKEYDLT